MVFKQFLDSYRSSITVPVLPESIRGSQHIGFDLATASRVYDSFSSFVEKDGYETYLNMLEFARDHLAGARDPKSWVCYGITEELRSRVMDPRFKDIFETQTFYYCVHETVCTAWLTMISIHERLKHTGEILATCSSPARDAVNHAVSNAVLHSDATETPYSRGQPYSRSLDHQDRVFGRGLEWPAYYGTFGRRVSSFHQEQQKGQGAAARECGSIHWEYSASRWRRWTFGSRRPAMHEMDLFARGKGLDLRAYDV